MKSIDIMKTENGFNIITNGGGSFFKWRRNTHS